MLELARSIKNLSVFTHISTCYVNCDQSGLIKEEIYEKGNLRPMQSWIPRKS
jgi:hypothetical protein